MAAADWCQGSQWWYHAFQGACTAQTVETAVIASTQPCLGWLRGASCTAWLGKLCILAEHMVSAAQTTSQHYVHRPFQPGAGLCSCWGNIWRPVLCSAKLTNCPAKLTKMALGFCLASLAPCIHCRRRPPTTPCCLPHTPRLPPACTHPSVISTPAAAAAAAASGGRCEQQ
jgi:hypothetical protein